ncbi:MAG: diguanylate cyclase [Solirubrobacteraceae bacterium]
MSFRNRLGLFFVLIVIVPMMAVAVLLFGLLAKGERSTGDADIGARQVGAQRLFSEQQRAAEQPLASIGRDRILSQALLSGNNARARKRAGQLLVSQRVARIVFARGARPVVSVGDRTAIAPARLELKSSSRTRLGILGVSVVEARAYAEEVRRVTDLHVVVRNGARLLASTLDEAADLELPDRGAGMVQLDGSRYRVAGFPPGGFPGQQVRIFTLGLPATTAGAVRDGRIVIGAILLGFLVIALICAVLVSRSLQRQLASFLEAARRLAAGDFSAQVSTVGKDDFAGLGEAFNAMSRELERRLAELSQERARAQYSMRRLGEAIASKLDRDALLQIVVRSAVDGVPADAGRAYVRGTDGVTLEERARAGDMNGLDAVVTSVEADALRRGSPGETSDGEVRAMAHPLRTTDGAGEAVGVVSVGRSGRAFTQSERELFHYLAAQAARSMESVERHETVTRESITDDLTGLSNRRAFDEALAGELERARRFGGTLGLVLLDLDDFKTINDTYGHPQGDLVLREVARVLRESSREIDHPARYGGEELALVLPGTDLEGAFNLAERVRERIEALRLPRLTGPGTLRVTASCGVAAVPLTPADQGALVTAADQALYEAKRSGKNKSVRAR